MIDLDAHLPGIQAADASAFAQWLSSAEPSMRDTLRGFATHVDTEAVLQEALLRVWQLAPKHRADGRANSLYRFAVRIARNLALDEVRRMRREVRDPALLDDAADPVSPRPPDPHLRRALLDCRGSITGKPGQVLALRLEQAGTQSDGELAQRLGMRTNTFLQNFTRARKLLVDCLRRHGVDLSTEMT